MTYRGYIFDLACPEQGRRDGTIYRGEEVIPGAPQTIAELRRRGCGVVFLSLWRNSAATSLWNGGRLTPRS